MTRVAIYARYSSDLQSDQSIEDQIRICRQRAEREGWYITNCYTDQALSGASMMRPGIQSLLQDALAGKFDIVSAEALDRLSRDQEDIAGIFKRLSFADIKIITVSEGEVSNLHIGLKGTMNALFLKDLALKTHRGLRGRVEAGKSGGGITYGYDIVRSIKADGEPLRGERKINDDQARIVERIFNEYVAGKSPKAIAVQLNKEKILGPSGRAWGPSTIHGNRRRGTGILNNELYIGRLIWNRLRYVKDPSTGKRVSRLNPEEDWITTDVPEQRIIDQELWDKAKAKQGEINEHSATLWKTNRPRNLFSYLLKCGECGGGFSMISQTHLGCSNARNKGTCSNRLAIKREKLEQAVLGSLQTHLMDEEACAEFCAEYTRHMNKLHMERNASLHAFKAEYEKIDRQQDKIVDAVADGVPFAKFKEKMTLLEARRLELEHLLETAQETPLLFHPNIAQRYHQEVRQLIRSLNVEEHRTEAADLLRSLVDKIVLTPTEARDRLVVDLYGDLAGILAIASNRDRSTFVDDLSVFNQNMQEALVAGVRNTHDLPGRKEAMVAGVGFEPTTFRL